MIKQIDKLTNNELLRKIQDLTEKHERLKSEIIIKCGEVDMCEIEYNKLMEHLGKRMGKK